MFNFTIIILYSLGATAPPKFVVATNKSSKTEKFDKSVVTYFMISQRVISERSYSRTTFFNQKI